MLDSYLNIRYRGNNWFDGLEISERKDLEYLKNSCPVVYFDFKDIMVSSYDVFIQGMTNKISDLYRDHAESLNAVTQSKLLQDVNSILMGTANIDMLGRSLRKLTEVMEQCHGRKVVVLLDEYDNPVQNAYWTPDFNRILEFMKLMLGTLLKGNPSLHFAVVTGVSQISKESIISGLNNLTVNNILDRKFEDVRIHVERGSQIMYGLWPSREVCGGQGMVRRIYVR